MQFPVRAIALFAALTLVPAAAGAAPSSKGCDGFNGVWTTQWTGGGPVMLTLSGNSGTYDWKNGKVNGTVNGNVFAGTYAQDNQTGTFQFTLSPDGNALAGWYVIDQTTDKVDWNGTCSGAAAGPAAAPAASPASPEAPPAPPAAPAQPAASPAPSPAP